MPQLFNLGRDVQLLIVGPLGQPLILPSVTAFEETQVVSRVRWDRCDGIQLGADLPKGWEGTFSIDRASSACEDFIYAIESVWYANGTPGFSGAMTKFVSEVGGGVSTWQYTSATFSLLQGGTWHISEPTRQRLAFWAATKLRV